VLSSIGDFTGRLLSRHGALVEYDGDDLIAVLPPSLASALELGEYERLTFDPRTHASDALSVDYDSPLLDRFEPLVQQLTRAAVVPAPPLNLKRIDAQAVIESVTLTNGIARDVCAESARARYVGFFLHYELLADERVSGTTEVWVNTAARTAPHLAGLMQTLAAAHHAGSLSGAEHARSDDVAGVVADAWKLGSVRARHLVENRLRSAIESLRRRRSRDFTRLREYYAAIDDEIRRRARRGLAKQDAAAAKAEVSRLEATAHAYRARLGELVDRYRVRVRVRPLGALVCVLPVHRVTARFLRRSASRTVTLAWNPVDRALEPASCEGCGTGTTTVVLCDDRVHVLCPTCHGDCDTCGRPYCRACCPRCPRRHD
jgi:hypothetical protein